MYTISQKRKSGWEAAAGVVNKVSLEHPQGLRCLLLSSSGGSLLPLKIPTWLPQIQLPHAGSTTLRHKRDLLSFQVSFIKNKHFQKVSLLQTSPHVSLTETIPCPLLTYQWKRNRITTIGLRLIKIHLQRARRASSEVDGSLSFLNKTRVLWAGKRRRNGNWFVNQQVLSITLDVSPFPSKHQVKHIVCNFSSNPTGY